MAEVVPIDPNTSPPDGVLEITKVMLFDFSIAEDRRRFIIVETDMDDRVTRGAHEFT